MGLEAASQALGVSGVLALVAGRVTSVGVLGVPGAEKV